MPNTDQLERSLPHLSALASTTDLHSVFPLEGPLAGGPAEISDGSFGSFRAHRAKRELPFKRSGIPAAV